MQKHDCNLNKPNLLIYAHYYYPDVASTGQILKELAEGMLDSFNIIVICVVPSYGGTVDAKYREKKYYFENINGIQVIRVKVPDFDKTIKMSRVKNILTYFLRTLWVTGKIGKVDYIYSISQPPILGGILGMLGKWRKGAKYIYNIQDFNPEQIMAVEYSKNKLLLRIMLLIDKLSCRVSDKVILVGRDMQDTLKKRFKNKKVPKYAIINNWINESEIYPLDSNNEHVIEFRQRYGLVNKFVMMYSGNIGLYYDLENILKVIKNYNNLNNNNPMTLNGQEVVFAFVGDGSIKDKLIQYKIENQLDNVIFIPYQNKDDLIYSLNASDVQFVVNAKGIKGVSVPSKCYGVMASGTAILAVLEKESEARLIIEESGSGLVCEPGDYNEIEKYIQWFAKHAGTEEINLMGKKGREYLENNLAKDISIRKYIDEILNS